MITKVLVLHFEDANKKKVTISLERPKLALTEAEIKAAMDLVIAKNIFHYTGADLVTALSAEIVETNTTEFDLVL